MSAVTSILRVRRHYSGSASNARASARKFTGYTQYRDQHPDSELAQDVDGLVGYMRFRDVSAGRGRMFDAAGVAGSLEREQLVGFIDSSFTAIHQRDHKRSTTNNLSYYDLIISPQDARGLDLKGLTRATMAQLGREAGTGGLPPWIAAEHRNTKHPHVHVVVAGIRPTPEGPYRTLQITPARLERMKAAMSHDLERQREVRVLTREHAVQALAAPGMAGQLSRDRGMERQHSTQVALSPSSLTADSVSRRHNRAPRLTHSMSRLAGRLADHYRREMVRAIRERKWASERDSLEQEHSF